MPRAVETRKNHSGRNSDEPVTEPDRGQNRPQNDGLVHHHWYALYQEFKAVGSQGFFFRRSGTTVVMTPGTASGDSGFVGRVSFFGFLASLVLRWPLGMDKSPVNMNEATGI